MNMKNRALPPIGPFPQIFLQPPQISTNAHSKTPTITSPAKVPPGAKIIGNYLLGKTIGQGTFGRVHLAMHLPTSEKVAVKLIDKKSMRPKDVNRVKNEISILSSVRHRNILQLYQIIQTEKSVLLITQFLQRGEVFRQIIKQKRFSEEQACTYFQQVVAGVEYLHRNKIAHRDLKPENILIDYDGQLKIVDFGLSTAFVKGKDLNSYCGSPCYVAPEILEGKVGYNPVQSDLWSLGVVLFVMLAGYLPFCNQDINTIYKQIIACDYKIPSHVSAGAKDLIQSLLVKAPHKRISLRKVREHEWFNKTTPTTAYGLNLGEKLKIDQELLERMKDTGINEAKLRQGLQKGQNNRDTASYFIFMKKLAKNNEKVESYIGGNYFNPKYIEIDTNVSDNETQTFSDPITVVEAAQGPQMQGQLQQALASASCFQATQWNIAASLQEQKQVETQQLLRGLVKNVFSFLASMKSTKDPLQEFLSQICSQQSRITRIITQKKEVDFYVNKRHKKSRFNINISHQPQLQLLMVQPQNGRRKRAESKKQEVSSHSFRYKRELTTTKSEKKEFRLNTRNTIERKKVKLLEDMTISIELKKNASKILPYLTPKELTKLVIRERTKSKFKDYPSSQKSLK